MPYKKKRYDIHIRMYPKDFDMLWDIMGFLRGWNNDWQTVKEKKFEDFVWKLHNKMVEINRR